MVDYVGQPCFGCHAVFTKDDDIVVCPECGTPYHRDCYRAAGACTNTALHETGTSWQAEKKAEIAAQKRIEKQQEIERQQAERERGDVAASVQPELYDGVRLNPDDPCVGLDPAENMDGVSVKEMAAFIASNQFYYLPLFRLMQRTGKKISFNLLSLFCPHLYFANRKMWAMTIVTILVNLVLTIPSMMLLMQKMNLAISVDVTTVAFTRILDLSQLISMVFSFVCCMFSNYLYYRFARKQITRIKGQAKSEQQLYQTLHEAGGTSLTNMICAVIIESATMFTLMIALMFFL